jgi:hypothetical protein
MRPVRLNLSAWLISYGTIFFSLATNQPTVLLVMAYQPSEQGVVFFL